MIKFVSDEHEISIETAGDALTLAADACMMLSKLDKVIRRHSVNDSEFFRRSIHHMTDTWLWQEVK